MESPEITPRWNPEDIVIRRMRRSDMPSVLPIETDSFDVNWTEEDFEAALRQPNWFARVAAHEEQVIGYMIYELQKRNLVVLNLAVNRVFRRRGIGARMIEKLIEVMSKQGRRAIRV